ncbi:MAG: hypothetical protein ABH856_03635, partial [Patescibacteria group bacterium]
IESSGGGKKKGLKGKMNCRRLRFASVALAFARAPSVRSGLASLGLRYFWFAGKIFASFFTSCICFLA